MALDDLSQPGVIESLIQDGRVPVHFGTLIKGDEDPKMLFWVPPQGTQIGDTVEGSPTIGFRFKSPEGQDRGAAKMHVVPMQIGEQIRNKVTAVFTALHAELQQT